MKTKRLPLFLIFGIGTAMILVITFLCNSLWPNLFWKNEPFHSTIEALGALVAIFISLVLYQKKQEEGGSRLYLLAMGFLNMGLLDGFHAVTVQGQGFILLRSVASLAGSFWFALVWLPSVGNVLSTKRWIPLVIVGSTLFGICVLLWRGFFPIMLVEGNFTAASIAINYMAGIFFIAATLNFMIDFYRSGKAEILSFTVLSLMFGLSGFMFGFSKLWDTGWWLLHFVRLAAYSVALGYVVRSYLQMNINLRNTIYECKNIEDALIESETRYKQISENLQGWIWEVDKNGLYTYASPIVEKLLDYKPKELVYKKHFYDLFIPEDREELKKAAFEMLGQKQSFREFINRNVNKNGEIVWFSTSGVPILDNNGNLLGYRGLDTNITERMQAEEMLRDSEEKFRSISTTAQDAVIMIDNDGTITFWNESSERIFGFTEEEALGKEVHKLITPQRYHKKANQGFTSFKKSGIGAAAGKTLELEGQRKNGSKFLVELSISGFKIKDEWQAVAMIKDITLRKQNEQELVKYRENLEKLVKERTAELEEIAKDMDESQQSLAYLLEDVNETRDELENTNIRLKNEVHERELKEEEAKKYAEQLNTINAELGAFSYSVSHDLRAPLRHMSGFIGLLKKHAEKSLDQKSRNYISIIHNASKKMSLLIDSLLSFSRTGRAEIKKIKIDTNRLVKQVIQELKPDTKGRKIEWDIATVPAIFADNLLLRQVMVNLFSNAVKFTGTRKQAKIKFGSMPDNDGNLVLFVRDNGVGFNPKYKDKLFDVFQRLHSNDEFEGVGVGLANVRRIITRHGGQIWAESEVGKGATFYFSLPPK